MVQLAREALRVMQNDSKHMWICGVLALKFLMLADKATPEQVAILRSLFGASTRSGSPRRPPSAGIRTGYERRVALHMKRRLKDQRLSSARRPRRGSRRLTRNSDTHFVGLSPRCHIVCAIWG
jgi:hypothetical protein